jgi:hypothetical protein
MHNRRMHPRYGVRIEGKLMSPDISQCVNVIIRNLSESGALVTALGPTDELPERLYLWQRETRTLFECVVQWRNSDRIMGLRFTEECSRISVQELLDTVVPERELAPTAAPVKLAGAAAPLPLPLHSGADVA